MRRSERCVARYEDCFLLKQLARLLGLRRELFEDTRSRILSAQAVLAARKDQSISKLREAELSVFSQFGDDGIIQFLISQVRPRVETFVEIGVGDYTESNTRFLLVKDNWRGLIIDCQRDAIARVRKRDLMWRHDLTAVAAFVTRENVNELLEGAGIRGRIGLLSLDVDGNDYWIWQALEAVTPDIVVVEYNSVFGPREPVAVPYASQFDRAGAHYSHLYWGASLPALVHLGAGRGYVFCGSNSAGNNAYFVRREWAGNVPEETANSGYVEARFRESRGHDGGLTYLTGAKGAEIIADMPLINVVSGATTTVGAALSS